MIKNKLVIISFLFTVSSCRQESTSSDFTVHPEELIKICNYDIDKFDSYLSRKGYNLTETTDGLSIKQYVYDSKENLNTNNKTFFEITRGVNSNNENKFLAFMKRGNENYTELKDKLSELGFQYIRTTTFAGSPTFVYTHNGIMVRLAPANKNSSLLVLTVIRLAVEPLSINLD